MSAWTRVALPLIAVGVQSGCMLTRGLWAERDEGAADPVVAVTVWCEAVDVQQLAPEREAGDAADPSTDEHGLLVRFVPEDRPSLPLHLQRYSQERPGRLLLRPDTEDDWRAMAGAAPFRPDSWDLRVTNATYFSHPHANARLRFFGTVEPGAVGAVVPRAELPPELPPPMTARSVLHDPTQEALRAFVRHDWAALLAPELAPRRWRPEPVAWLDPDGEVLPVSPLAGLDGRRYRPPHPRLEQCGLLGRLRSVYGEELWVRVPVAVLRQGRRLRLAREGDRIAWSLTRIWRAVLAPPGAPPTSELELPLRSRTFAYRWGEEVPAPELDPALKVMLTPMTVALDLIIATNPHLMNLYRYLTDTEWPEAETRVPRR